MWASGTGVFPHGLAYRQTTTAGVTGWLIVVWVTSAAFWGKLHAGVRIGGRLALSCCHGGAGKNALDPGSCLVLLSPF